MYPPNRYGQLLPSDASQPTLTSPPPSSVQALTPDYGYGARWNEQTQSYSGQPKGLGFLGPLKTKTGDVMSEYSRDGEINGKPVQYPLIVPTLSKQEVTTLLNLNEGDKVPASIEQKAAAHAKARIDQGLDPFALPGEERLHLFPELPRQTPPRGRPR